jgi:hypothetical protein
VVVKVTSQVEHRARDPKLARASQVAVQNRTSAGMPSGVFCAECDTVDRYWTDNEVRVWRCATCYPPGSGQLRYTTVNWD